MLELRREEEIKEEEIWKMIGRKIRRKQLNGIHEEDWVYGIRAIRFRRSMK